MPRSKDFLHTHTSVFLPLVTYRVVSSAPLQSAVLRAHRAETIVLEIRCRKVPRAFNRDRGECCRRHVTTYMKDQMRPAVAVKNLQHTYRPCEFGKERGAQSREGARLKLSSNPLSLPVPREYRVGGMSFLGRSFGSNQSKECHAPGNPLSHEGIHAKQESLLPGPRLVSGSSSG